MPGVGDVLGGKYRLDRVLGEGGMATVFAAENTWTGRRVAIKTIHPAVLRVAGVMERFRIEARAASQVRHANVIDVLDLGVDEASGLPFIVQEFLEGETLQARLDRLGDRTFAPVDAIRLVLPIVDALAAAHAQSVVHRDLKPSNIFLTQSPGAGVTPKVIDFGISKLLDGGDTLSFKTQTGMQLGTPAYMSPEQARGDADIDGLTDVWSVGVLLYELLSRRFPHEAPTNNLLIARVIYEAPTPLPTYAPDVPEHLVGIVHRALAPDRERRWPSMMVFGESLRAWLAAQDLERTRQIAVQPKVLEVAPEVDTTPVRSTPPEAPTRALPEVTAQRETMAVDAAFPAAPPPGRDTQIAWSEVTPVAPPAPARRSAAVLVAAALTGALVIGAIAAPRHRPAPSAVMSSAPLAPAVRPAVAQPVAPMEAPVAAPTQPAAPSPAPPAPAAPAVVRVTPRHTSRPASTRAASRPTPARPASHRPAPRRDAPVGRPALTVDERYP